MKAVQGVERVGWDPMSFLLTIILVHHPQMQVKVLEYGS